MTTKRRPQLNETWAVYCEEMCHACQDEMAYLSDPDTYDEPDDEPCSCRGYFEKFVVQTIEPGIAEGCLWINNCMQWSPTHPDIFWQFVAPAPLPQISDCAPPPTLESSACIG